MQITKIFPPSKLGVVNVRYKMDNMEFDAAIDFEHELHAYELSCFKSKVCDVPIELFNCSENWDIWMIYSKFSRQQMHEFVAAGIIGTPLETLIESETQQWIDTDPEDLTCTLIEEEGCDDQEEEVDPYEDYLVSVRRAIDPTPVPGDPEYEHLKAVEEQLQRERDFVPSPQDDFYQYLDRYGSDAFAIAIVEMLKSGELPVTWEQAGLLWERGGKTS